jgi:hypothetical protein
VRWPEYKSSIPTKITFENFQIDDKIIARWRETPLQWRVTPPEDPQVSPVEAAIFACMIGAISTLLTAMILTRTSFESKTKTAIAFAVGSAVPILMYTNPLIGVIAFAILFVTGCTVCKEPSSTDGLLKLLSSDDRRTFSAIDATFQREREAFFRERQEQELRNMPPIRPMFHPLVIQPRERMPLPRFVLPPFFFNDFPAIQNLQSHTIAGG